MSESTLTTILVTLFILLILLLLSYIYYPAEKLDKKPVKDKPKSTEIKREIDTSKPLSFEDIVYILGNRESSKEELMDAIEKLIRYHGKIHAKLGDLPHPDFKRYQELIIALCKNRSADKDVIISLNQKLRALNIKYAYDIDEAVSKGIEGRGF